MLGLGEVSSDLVLARFDDARDAFFRGASGLLLGHGELSSDLCFTRLFFEASFEDSTACFLPWASLLFAVGILLLLRLSRFLGLLFKLRPLLWALLLFLRRIFFSDLWSFLPTSFSRCGLLLERFGSALLFRLLLLLELLDGARVFFECLAVPGVGRERLLLLLRLRSDCFTRSRTVDLTSLLLALLSMHCL